MKLQQHLTCLPVECEHGTMQEWFTCVKKDGAIICKHSESCRTIGNIMIIEYAQGILTTVC